MRTIFIRDRSRKMPLTGTVKTLAAALLGLALGAAEAHAAETQAVNIYSARHYTTDQHLWESFTAQTGIAVHVVEADHDQLVQRLLSEGAASPADLFVTVDAGLAKAAGQDLLQPVTSDILARDVPAHLRHPDGLWYGLAVRARILAYSKARVDPAELSTYEALADPRLEGRVLARSGTHIYNLGLTGSMIATHGVEATEAWVRGLVANFARPPEGGDTDQLKAVAAGLGDIALSNSYYLARLAASDKPEDRAVADKLGAFFPNQDDRGTHVNISGAGVLKHAPNRGNAIKLLEFLVSPEAQSYFANVSFEYPVNPAVAPHAVLAAWGPFKHDTLNADTFAANGREAARVLDRAGWR
jgi:iron(III) transport system substrate-binding protein